MEQGKPFSVGDNPLVDFDAVCRKVRAAVEPARAHAVSLHDESGDVLWLSESTMGPDEHDAVREALDAFANVSGPAVLAYDLGDARSALLLRAVNAQRALVGAVMVIMDTRGIKQDDKGVVRMMTPQLQRAVSEFAAMRPDVRPDVRSDFSAVPTLTLAPAWAPASSPASGGRTLAQSLPAAAAPALASTLGRASAPTGSAIEGTAAPFELSLADSVRIPKPTLPPVDPNPAASATPGRPPRPVAPDIDRLRAALRRSPIALHLQRLVPLTRGSELKRYEVLLRSKSAAAPNAAPHAMLKAAVDNGLGSMIDRRVLTELIGWLVRHPAVWQGNAAMFSVNLTGTALQDEHFIKFVALCLAKSSLPKATIAFEIEVAAAIRLGDKISEILTALHRLGCPVVLDDFGLRTECFALLRLPAVRYIKLAPDITQTMRSDRLSQAAITALVQMARVLGMHTVAKHVATAAEQEWLTALGVDFIQSNAVSPPVPIETLSRSPQAKA